MKRGGRVPTRAELMRAFPRHDLLDGWYFRVDEISAGVYLAEGSDEAGRTVSRTGPDPEELLAACVQDATRLRST